MTGVDLANATDAIEAGLRAFLFAPSEHARSKFTFGHDLFQEFVYDGLETIERARLHQRAAEARESSLDDDVRHAAEIARHFFAACEPFLRGSTLSASLTESQRDLLDKTRRHSVRAAQRRARPHRVRRCGRILRARAERERGAGGIGSRNRSRSSSISRARSATRATPNRLAERLPGHSNGLGKPARTSSSRWRRLRQRRCAARPSPPSRSA